MPDRAAEAGTDRARFSGGVARLAALALALLLLIASFLDASPLIPRLLLIGLILLIGFGWRRAPAAAAETALLVRAPQAEAELQAVLDALAAPTLLIDRRGVTLHANHAAIKAFPGLRQGHPISSAIRAPELLDILDLVFAGQREANASLLEKLPIERSFEVSIRRLASEPRGLPLRLGQAFAVIHMADTTQARRIEAMRVDFVANASHELRTPLASILGFVETLQGPAKDDAAARGHFLEIMATQARRMARLIDDLLSLSRIEMHAHIPPSGVVDLGLLLPELVDALSGLARERGVTMRLHQEGGVPCQVTGDRDELLRLFENLIENAVKYGQSGQFVDITIDRPEEEAMCRVTVRDYGPGIDEAHLPRLTERFYRADIHESRILGGTGLGLAIVKHIVARHRGRLQIASRKGEGATFTVLLPAFG